MKKQILCGLAGALVLLLVQIPADLQAMDSGMMDSGGYRGYDMGPGMMHYGLSPDLGMGPGMMGQGYEDEPHYYQNPKYLDRNGAERIFEDYLKSRHNPNSRLLDSDDVRVIFLTAFAPEKYHPHAAAFNPKGWKAR